MLDPRAPWLATAAAAGLLIPAVLQDAAAQGVRIIAPAGFMQEATSENVLAGVAMGRRADYMYGRRLARGPRGHVDTGLGKEPPRGGHIGILAPTDTVPIVRERARSDTGEFVRRLEPAAWNFHPAFMKESKRPQFNSRIETVATNGLWKGAFASGRCIVPMRGYYEWTGEPGKKRAHYLHGPDDLLAAAGISTARKLDDGTWEVSTSIITREARDASGEVHDRMPVYLPLDAIDHYLDPAKLSPADAVKFALPPGGKPKHGGAAPHGGVLAFAAPANAGVYQVTLSGPAWIDVVQDGISLKSADHSGAKDCPGLRKSVRFALQAAPVILQLSDAPEDSIKVAIVPVE